jgi:hypothetical protein
MRHSPARPVEAEGCLTVTMRVSGACMRLAQAVGHLDPSGPILLAGGPLLPLSVSRPHVAARTISSFTCKPAVRSRQ